MAEFPAMPLWIQRYLADTEHLSFEEHGAYMRLLMAMWIAPNQRIPDDDEWLARRFHCDPAVVTKLLRPIIKEFCNAYAGMLMQKALQREWSVVRAKTERRRRAAKMRWDKENGEYNAYAPTPTPTPTPTKIDRGSDADRTRAKKRAHTPAQKAKGQPKQEAKRSPRAPMPEAWAPSEAGIGYATDAGIASARVPYLIRRCRDYHIRNGTMIAGERGLAATWRTWCDHEVKFEAEKNGTDVAEDSTQQKGYRPEGWTDADEHKLAARSTTTSTDLLDDGRPVRDQDGIGVGNGRGRHS